MSLIQVIDPLVLNECAKFRRQAATSLFVGEQVQTKGILSSIHERGICGGGSCVLEYVAKQKGRNFFRYIKNRGKIRMILSKRGHPLIVFERFDVPLTTIECLIAVSVCYAPQTRLSTKFRQILKADMITVLSPYFTSRYT